MNRPTRLDPIRHELGKPKDEMVCIYAIKFLGAILYVGSALNLQKRIANHKSCKGKKEIRHAIKNGAEFIKLETIAMNEADEAETSWIVKYKAIGQCNLNTREKATSCRLDVPNCCPVKHVESGIIFRSAASAGRAFGLSSYQIRYQCESRAGQFRSVSNINKTQAASMV